MVRNRSILTSKSSLPPRLSFFFFVLVPNRAGAAELAIDVRVAALHTFFTQVNAVLGAHVAGFPIRMIGACAHYIPSNRFSAD